MATSQYTTASNASKTSKAQAMQHRSMPVLGLSCASCAASVQSMLSSQKGVTGAEVNYGDAVASIDFDPKYTDVHTLQQAVRAIGYDLVVENEQTAEQVAQKAEQARYKNLKSATIWSTLLSIPLMIISMWGMNLPYANLIMWLLATPVVFLFGGRFFSSALRQLRHGHVGMDTLVALSTGVAYLYSLTVMLLPEFWAQKGLPGHLYFESAAVVITFILLGKTLEMRAKGRTLADIKKLMAARPTTATLLKASGPTLVAVSEIRPGDQLLVKPGEAIAVDGSVLTGQPLINESMITGEATASLKQKGDLVYAGTLNTNTAFSMQATNVGGETVMAGIIRLVKTAQRSKAPIQQLVDKIAARFVAAVLAIALITFFAWWLLGGLAELSRGIIAVVTVLVIACPCALGLATPAALMVGIGRGAAMGILIKDAAHLQKLSAVTDIVLDKTGTLTEGKPVVLDALWLCRDLSDMAPETNRQQLTAPDVLSAIESTAQHPLAEAIAQYALSLAKPSKENKGAFGQNPPLINSRFLPGLGIEATFNADSYYVGNARLMAQKQIFISKEPSDALAPNAAVKRNLDAEATAPFLKAHQTDTIVYFARKNEHSRSSQLLAVLALADPLKPDAPFALQRLRDLGIHLHILTGDNDASAAKVAALTGIRRYKAGLLPADKLNYIQALQAKSKTVAMVGDGINDSAALAQADVSIAMSKGSQVAMDVAAMTLVGDQLSKIADGIALSKLTGKTIRANLFWAFFYNLIGIPIAAGVLYPFTGFMLNPMVAGAAMALSSLCVLAASLRLRYRSLL